MPRSCRALGALLLFASLLPASASALEGIVLKDRVNLRARPSLSTEVLHQLGTGDRVDIVRFVQLEDPAEGEPGDWYCIRIPREARVWVATKYLESGSGEVLASRLNVRAGPGERFSVVGRVERGARLEMLESQGEWTAVAPPEGTSVFVAAHLLSPSRTEEPPEPGPGAEAQEPAFVGLIVEEEEPGLVAPGRFPPPDPESPGAGDPPPSPIYTAAQEGRPRIQEQDDGSVLGLTRETLAGLKRTVHREGIVRRIRMRNAPADYRLTDLRAGRTINYLHLGKPLLDMEETDARDFFSDVERKRVRISGVEVVDPRFPSTPILTVESLRPLE